MACPAVALGVVGELCFQEPCSDCDETVEVTVVGDASVKRQLVEVIEYLLGERVRLR